MNRHTFLAGAFALVAVAAAATSVAAESARKAPMQVGVPATAATVAATPSADGKSMSLALRMPNGEVLNVTLAMTKEGYPMQPGPYTVIYREWSDLQG